MAFSGVRDTRYHRGMRHVLGWLVVAVVSLVALALGIGSVALVAPGTEQAYIGGACFGIIGGIAGGLWLKDKIVGVKDPGPPRLR